MLYYMFYVLNYINILLIKLLPNHYRAQILEKKIEIFGKVAQEQNVTEEEFELLGNTTLQQEIQRITEQVMSGEISQAEAQQAQQVLVGQVEIFFDFIQYQNVTEKQLQQLSNTTMGDFIVSMRSLELEQAELEKDLNTIFKYCLGSSCAHIFIYCVIVMIVIWKRNTRAVRSRGTTFLVHYLVSAFFAIFCALLFNAVQLNQIEPLEYGAEKFINVYFSLAFFLIFFSMSCVSAIICRMRIVYNAFDIKSSLNIKNFWTYFHIIPFHLVIFAVAVIPFAIDNLTETNIKRPISSALVFNIMALWLAYYTYHLRNAPNEFSDAMTNLRCALYMVVCFSIVITVDIIETSSMVGIIGYQFAVQSFVVLYLLDSWCELGFNYYIQSHTSRIGSKTASRTNNGTNRRESVGKEKSVMEKCESVLIVDHIRPAGKSSQFENMKEHNYVYDGSHKNEAFSENQSGVTLYNNNNSEVIDIENPDSHVQLIEQETVAIHI
eukprot:Pgem_evm1s810